MLPTVRLTVIRLWNVWSLKNQMYLSSLQEPVCCTISGNFLNEDFGNPSRSHMALIIPIIGGLLGGCIRSWWSPFSRLAIGRDASSSAGVLFNGLSGGIAVALLSSYGSFQGLFYGLSMQGVVVFALVLGYCFSDVIDSMVFVVLNPPWKKKVRKR